MPHNKKVYEVSSNEFNFHIDEASLALVDMVKMSGSKMNVIKDMRSLTADVTVTDVTGKKMTIDIDGETFHIDIKDELDQMLAKMGFDAVAGKHVREIRAPMPGLVLQIAVEDGQQVNEGDKILILEAMKMENSILVHANAVIKRIVVSAGQAVEKGQVLVELE
jgi:biotin carboxyl carrier protein